jgi:hypothetical protein
MLLSQIVKGSLSIDGMGGVGCLNRQEEPEDDHGNGHHSEIFGYEFHYFKKISVAPFREIGTTTGVWCIVYSIV